MLRPIVLAGLLCALSACGPGFAVTTPAGFAELEDQEKYGYRATTAEGVIIGVRKEDNSPYGDLSFWSGALDAHLRRAGYTAVEAVEVKSEDGIPGKQIRYTQNKNGRDHSYWVTVFVTEESVVTVEAGGDVEYFEKSKEAVTKAIASLEIG